MTHCTNNHTTHPDAEKFQSHINPVTDSLPADPHALAAALPQLAKVLENFEQQTEDKGSRLWELYEHSQRFSWLTGAFLAAELEVAGGDLWSGRMMLERTDHRGCHVAGNQIELEILLEHPELLTLLATRLFDALSKGFWNGDHEMKVE